jgi:hypothetical protein
MERHYMSVTLYREMKEMGVHQGRDAEDGGTDAEPVTIAP